MMGSVTVHDSTGTLSSSDISQLTAHGGQWPFDAHVAFESAASLEALEDDAHQDVTGPNVVAVFVDPGHHKVAVRFGTGTHVKTGDYDSISKAGNAHFRSHEMADGVTSILLRAKASAEAHEAMSVSSEPVVIHQGLSGGEWLLIVALVTGLACLVVWAWRRKRRDQDRFEAALADNVMETNSLRSRNLEAAQAASFDARLRRPLRVAAPAPFVQQTTVVTGSGGGSGDFATGMLVGEMMERDRSPSASRYLVDRLERDRGGSSSSYDSGSSSSYSSDSSSSSDSGGSSSDWSSGGSSDFGSGGGGFDGGGGSSGW